MSHEPGLYDFSPHARRIRRRILRLEIAAAVLIALLFCCIVAVSRAQARTAARLELVVNNHNALIEALNRRSGTTGGRLESLGVPHGGLIGDALDAVLPPRSDGGRRRARR